MKKICLSNSLYVSFAIFCLIGSMRLEAAEISDLEIQECSASLDMNRVNFRKPPYVQNSHLLKKYFLCRAAANDDGEECNNLPAPTECLHLFKHRWLFYGRLLKLGKATAEIKKACLNTAKEKDGGSVCEALITGLINNDATLCDGLNSRVHARYCGALVKQDANLCPDNDCQNLVIYISALKSKDAKMCENITKSDLKWLCKGAVSQDSRVCEKEENIEGYKRKTCIEDLKFKKKFQTGGRYEQTSQKK